MTEIRQSRWRQWMRRLVARRPEDEDSWAERERVDISDNWSGEMRARALECNLFVMLPDRDIMIVGADDQDPGPIAPPFTDFMRVVRDEGPAEYEYIWMIDLLRDDPRVFLEIGRSPARSARAVRRRSVHQSRILPIPLTTRGPGLVLWHQATS